MLNSKSVKARFLVSIGSNVIRSMIGFISGLLIARGLSPSGYGDLTFLLGTFIAIRSLLDMGSSSAFYTFLSRHTQGLRFYMSYFAWLALQFVVTLTFVVLIVPDAILEKIWLGHSRDIIVVAFMAVFMQQQIWQTVGQIGESMRKTLIVQALNLLVALIYLATVSLLLVMDRLTLLSILILMIGQYAAATLLAYHFLKKDKIAVAERNLTIKQMALEYWVYCRPMMVLSLVSFLYDFADKWMLQKFGGASQQGYFQISSQFAAISLLATTSILSVLWKEIADAWAKHDHTRIAMLYRRINRGLVMLGAIITGLLLPWAEQLVMIFLGAEYVEAWPVLAIMLLYPIHQSMGQVGGTMLLASGNTHKFMVVSVGIMLVSLPFSYLMLAPSAGPIGPGLGMGAMGIALKMVLLGIVSVNIQAWVIARYSGWKFDWTFQVVGIPLMLGLGYLVKMLVGLLWDLEGIGALDLIVPMIADGLVYALVVLSVVWFFPWLVGMNKEEISKLFALRQHQR